MQCKYYRHHEIGELSDADYALHAATCIRCQQLAARDAELLRLTRSLQQPVRSPMLWAKIENQLRDEQQRQQRPAKSNRAGRFTRLRIAAMLVLAIGAGYVLGQFFNDGVPEGRLLTASLLERVEKKERDYEAAISELESQAEARLASMDTGLMLLYRDRLETIDAQILRCKEALAENPANAHIRRYLLLALNDKRETLKEVLDTNPPNS